MGSLAVGPISSLAILTMALSIGFRNSVAFLSAIQATGLLTFAPVGLPPTEHASLHWTHPSATIYLARLTARGLEVLLHAPQQGRLHCFPKADCAFTAAAPFDNGARRGRWLRLIPPQVGLDQRLQLGLGFHRQRINLPPQGNPARFHGLQCGDSFASDVAGSGLCWHIFSRLQFL